MTATTKRPTTCNEVAALDPALGAEGCKRLPRHGGEHRGYLTARAARKAVAAKAAKAAAKPKAAPKAAVKSDDAVVRDIRRTIGKPRGRLNVTERKAALQALAALVDSGALTAGRALGLTARFV